MIVFVLCLKTLGTNTKDREHSTKVYERDGKGTIRKRNVQQRHNKRIIENNNQAHKIQMVNNTKISIGNFISKTKGGATIFGRIKRSEEN